MYPKSYTPPAHGSATDVVDRLISNEGLAVGQENKDRRSMIQVSFSCGRCRISMQRRSTPFRTPMRGHDGLCFLNRECIILVIMRLISQARSQELIGRARDVVFDTDQWVFIEEYDAVCIASMSL